MKDFPRRLLCGVCTLILSLGLCLNAAAKENTTPLSLSPLSLEEYPLYQQEERAADAYIVMEATTGRVLCGQNIHERLAMASTTKIIGAMMVLEQPNLDESFTVDPDAIQVEGSSMGLQEGDSVSLYALACGMLLPSGNDAANTAGVRLYGSIKGFVQAMNQRAQELGLHNTHYVTACGLDAEGHYSTAFDLAKLTRVALQNEDFAFICSQSSMKVKFGNPPYERWLQNYNRLLELYPDCIGVKTGFTTLAGRTLVTCAERDGARYVCVTLNDPDDWDDHKALYDWAFANYSFAEVIPAGLSYEVPLISGAEMTAPAETEGAAYALIQNGESYDMELELPAFAFAPISEGERAGRAVACSDGQEIASVRIVYSEDVEVDRELKLTPGERFLRFWVLTGLSAPFYLE